MLANGVSRKGNSSLRNINEQLRSAQWVLRSCLCTSETYGS